MNDDHERSRRERAVDLVGAWARGLDRRASAARKLVEDLSAEQAKAFFKQEAFEIELKHLPMLNSALVSNIPQQTDRKFLINEEQCSELRWQVVTYLNTLESIFSSWRYGIADEDIIEEEFSYLVSNSSLMEKFRAAAGGNLAYPAIAQFVEQAQKRISSGKPPIGTVPRATTRPREHAHRVSRSS